MLTEKHNFILHATYYVVTMLSDLRALVNAIINFRVP
jgi:hypothetical protein